MKKVFIDAEELLLDSYRLAIQIYESGFRPDFIIGLWRGGSPVGIAVQDCLEYLGVETDHISVRTSYQGMSSYSDMIEKEGNIRVHGLQYVFDNLNSSDALLIVDDVYSDMIEKEGNIRVHGLQYVFDNLNSSDALLIVDDVYSTGLSVKAVIDRLSEKMRKNLPEDVRIATPWTKPDKNRSGRLADYFLHETDNWLVFPYELDGLTLDEIRVNKPELVTTLNDVIDFIPQ